MRCPCGFLCLLALPLVLGAGTPASSVRKEFINVAGRPDSGTARQFTVETRGFRILDGRYGVPERRAAVNDTLVVVGAGTIELTSSEPGKPLAVDVWMVVSADRSAPVRYTGRVVRIHRNDMLARVIVTTP